MGDMGLLETQTGGTDESFKLGRFSGEVFWHKSDLGDHSLPALAPLAALHAPENLVLGLHAHLGYGDVVLGGLVLDLLFDLLRDGLSGLFVFPIQKIGRESSFIGFLNGDFGSLLLESFDFLAELNLFGKSLFVVDLGLETSEFFGLGGSPPWLSGFLLSLTLFMIKSATMALAMKLDMFVLWHSLKVFKLSFKNRSFSCRMFSKTPCKTEMYRYFLNRTDKDETE